MQLTKAKILKQAGYALWYSALVFFCYLMLLIVLQYVPARSDVAFLRIKEDAVDGLYYRIAFFAHVYTGMFVLVAGILQIPARIRHRFPAMHRWCGRVYAYSIILITGPAGLVMGYYGNGGWISQSAFCLLAILWIFFTWMGVSAARSGDITPHKKWMYRSYALTLSAISLRLWKWGLVLLFQPRPMDLYQVVSWLGWVGNLLIAEVIIAQTFKNQPVQITNDGAPLQHSSLAARAAK